MNAIVHHYDFVTRHALHCFMQQNKVIISGSTALLALHSGMLQAKDLDLYVPIANQVAADEFLNETGYTIVGHGPDHSAREYENGWAIRVDRYAKGGKMIDVVYTKGSPVRAVAEFHSTLVMNYIAWYGLVCLYPALTLDKKALINADDERARERHERYEARGFQFMRRHPQRPSDGPRQACRRCFECPSTVRSLFDEGVMFVPFGGVTGDLSLYEENVIWRLNNNTCGGVSPGFTAGETSECPPHQLDKIVSDRSQVSHDDHQSKLRSRVAQGVGQNSLQRPRER